MKMSLFVDSVCSLITFTPSLVLRLYQNITAGLRGPVVVLIKVQAKS